MQATFKSTYEDLKKYNGIITVISELHEDEYDKEEVGQMWSCESNGETFHAFDDELTFDKVEETWEEKNMRANAFIGTGPSF
jgi:hypothetical protein